MKMRVGILFRHVYFREFCANVAASLSALGVSVEQSDHVSLAGADVLLYVGVHLFDDLPFHPNTVVAGIQTEQLGIGGLATSRLGRNRVRFECVQSYYDLLFDWIPGICESEGRRFLPYGCSRSAFTGHAKEFDVCFIGNIHHSRRELLLKSLCRDFQFYPDFSPGFGDAKNVAVDRSRILLNIRFYEDGGFESPRMFDYLSRGAFVISERVACSAPFVAGRDFVEFDGEEELRDLLIKYLSDAPERERIAASGHAVCQEHTWDVIAAQLLSALQGYTVRSNSRRFLGWLSSRMKCCMFEAKDQGSLAKRRLFGAFRGRK